MNIAETVHLRFDNNQRWQIYVSWSSSNSYYLLKTYVNSKNQKLSISKIFDYGIASCVYSEIFKKKKIQLIEHNPKEDCNYENHVLHGCV